MKICYSSRYNSLLWLVTLLYHNQVLHGLIDDVDACLQ